MKRNQRVAIAFLLSAIGDAGMVYANHGGLLFGLAAFAFAHICYIRGFGFKNTNIKLGIVISIYAILSISSTFVYHYLYVGKLQGSKFATLMIVSNMYCLLLHTSFWRAIDLQEMNKNELVYYIRALGMLMFVISDSMIAIDQFAIDIPYDWIPVMVLYYGAQGSVAWAESQVLMKSHQVKSE